MGYCKSVLRGKIIAISAYMNKSERKQMINASQKPRKTKQHKVIGE